MIARGTWRLAADIAERVLWTAVEMVLGYLSTEVTGLPLAWALPVALVVAVRESLEAIAAGRL